MGITKWSAEEIANDEHLVREVENSNIRQCSYCGMYVMVEEYGNEQTLSNGKVVYDCCDDCKEVIDQGKEPICEEKESYEDYIQDEEENELEE